LIALAKRARRAQAEEKKRIEEDESLHRLAASFPLNVGRLCAAGNLSTAALRVNQWITQIYAEWPAVATVGSLPFDYMFRQLPVEEQGSYWKMALTARAVSE
jgi:hypothetical protein